jgi:ParB family chromosome partitioning protein
VLAAASHEVDIRAIEANPYQPRATMDAAQLEQLADSIRTHGVIQPLVVTRGETPDRYILVAGERRWRAAKLAGLATVPVVVKDVATQAMLELALVENVVRADLSPLEEAAAYKQLIDEFGLTQSSVASRVGRSRVAVTNTLRLLNAPDEVQEALQAGRISEGHARALLGLSTAIDQVALLRVVEDRALNVRQTEEQVRRWSTQPGAASSSGVANAPGALRHVEEQLRRALATKVSVRPGTDGTGTVTIHYFTDEQLDDIIRRLAPESDF